MKRTPFLALTCSLVLATLGLAQASTKHKKSVNTHKQAVSVSSHASRHGTKTVKKSAKTPKPVHAKAKPAPKTSIRWSSYRDKQLKVSANVPAAWKIKKTSKAIGFTSPAAGKARAAVGILKSETSKSIDEAAKEQFEKEGRPTSWQRSDAVVAGQPAVRIRYVPKDHSDQMIDQYYVQTPKGPYLVQCMAPRRQWSSYSPLFSNFLQSVHFQ